VIVVSNTTPLNYLVLINSIDVLPSLFAEVYTPNEVVRELTSAKAPPAVRQWAGSPPSWLKLVDPSLRLISTLRLDLAEAQAISLAKERQIPDILIDERRGARVALLEGLFPVPTLAILERAAERELLDLPATIEKLSHTNIRIPADLITAALQRDADRKNAKKRP
jgi:predicted nucleic acid-binding protein